MENTPKTPVSKQPDLLIQPPSLEEWDVQDVMDPEQSFSTVGIGNTVGIGEEGLPSPLTPEGSDGYKPLELDLEEDTVLGDPGLELPSSDTQPSISRTLLDNFKKAGVYGGKDYTVSEATKLAKIIDEALGDRSPGEENIIRELAVNGRYGEDNFRKKIATKITDDFNRDNEQVIKEILSNKLVGKEFSPAELFGLTQANGNYAQLPQTALESAYSDMADKALLGIGRKTGNIPENEFDLYLRSSDFWREHVEKQEIVKDLLQQNQKLRNARGYGRAGYDVLRSVIPQYREAATSGFWETVKNVATLNFTAKSFDELALRLLMLPPAQMKKEVTDIYNQIAQGGVSGGDLLVAQEFLERFQSYTASQKALDNIFFAIDVIPAMGGAARLIRRGFVSPPRLPREAPPIAPQAVVPENVNIIEGGVEITKTRANGTPVHAYYNRESNTISINKEAVLDQWSEKPWRLPKVEGVTALDDGLFPTPDHWYNFVLQHEIEHTKFAHPEGWSTAQYENAINRRAIESLNLGGRSYIRKSVEPISKGEAENLKTKNMTDAQRRAAILNAAPEDMVTPGDKIVVAGAKKEGAKLNTSDSLKKAFDRINKHFEKNKIPSTDELNARYSTPQIPSGGRSSVEEFDELMKINDFDQLMKINDFDQLMKINKFDELMRIKAFDDLMREIDNLKKSPREVIREIPDSFNGSVATGNVVEAAPQTTSGYQRTLRDHAMTFLAEAVHRSKLIGRPEHLTTAGITKALEKAERLLAKQHATFKDHIIDFTREYPNPDNNWIASTTVRLGDEHGMPFNSYADAEHYAKNMFDLDTANDTIPWEIGVNRNGYYEILWKRNANEVDPEVAKAGLTPDATVNESYKFFDHILKTMGLRGAQFTSSRQMTRNAVAAEFGRNKMNELMKDFLGNLSKMHKDDVAAVGNVMKIDMSEYRTIIDPDTGEVTKLRGVYRRDAVDFEMTFLKANGFIASEPHKDLYFALKDLKEFEWYINNRELRTSMSRLGGHHVNLKIRGKEEGRRLEDVKDLVVRPVDNIPLAVDDKAHIIFLNNDGSFVSRSIEDALRDPALKEMVDNYPKYQLFDTAGGASAARLTHLNNDIPPAFIISKGGLPLRELDPVILPKREGWHSGYKMNKYMRQADLRELPDGTFEYRGQKTLYGHELNAEAEEVVKRMEEFRQGYLAAGETITPALRRLAYDHLPFTARELEDLYTRGIHNVRTPYLLTDDAMDVMLDPKASKVLTDTYGTIRDAMHSPFNLMDQIDKKFLGERNDSLYSSRINIGDQPMPKRRRIHAEEIDPMSMMVDSLRTMTRHPTYDLYKKASVEAWVAQFGDLIEAPNGNYKEIFRNPIHYFHNGVLKEKIKDKGRLQAAKSAKATIEGIMGTKSPFQETFGYITMKAVDNLFSVTKSESKALWANKWLSHTTDDPSTFFKSLAFHANIGLFNPAHAAMNAQMSAQVMQLEPVYGFRGFQLASIAKIAGLNPTPAIQEAIIRRATKLINKSSGGQRTLTRQEVKEMMGHFFNYGVEKLGSTNLLAENAADTNRLFASATSRFLEHGTVFFRKGEEFVNAVGFFTAYQKYMAKNNWRKLTQEGLNEIVAYSKDLTSNMNTTANANWQRGIFSVPTQFISFPVRLAETMFNKNLTRSQRFRLFATNALLYGPPTGFLGVQGLGALFPVLDLKDPPDYLKNIKTFGDGSMGIPSIKNWIFDNFTEGGKRDMTMIESAFAHGLMGTALKIMAGGQDVDPGGLAPPNAGRLATDIVEKSFTDIAFGPSGSTVGRAWNGGMGLAGAFYDYVFHDRPISQRAVENALSVVKTLRGGIEAYHMIKFGQTLSKEGKVVVDGLNPNFGPLKVLLNVSPQKVADNYTAISLSKDQTNAEKALRQDLYDTVKTFMDLQSRYIIDQDPDVKDAMNRYLDAIHTMIRAHNVSPDLMSRMMKQYYDERNTSQHKTNTEKLRNSRTKLEYRKDFSDILEKVNKERKP